MTGISVKLFAQSIYGLEGEKTEYANFVNIAMPDVGVSMEHVSSGIQEQVRVTEHI